MKSWGLVLGIGLWLSSGGAQAETFHQIADGAVQAVWDGLERCGLKRMNAYDPRLPRPQIPASEAVVNSRGQVLAYTLDGSPFFNTTYEFKNPNGGMIHSVSYGYYAIGFLTPYGGSVAAANSANVGGTLTVNTLCRGRTIPPAYFQACIRSEWIDVIVKQLCRFPN